MALGPEETRRKKEFLQAATTGQVKAVDFEPGTGIGKFDAKFDSNTKKITVTVKARFDFTENNQKWPASDRLMFKQKAKQLIEQNWSRQYTLACNRPGWEDIYADVDILLEDVQVGEHFPFRVANLMPGETTGGGLVNGDIPYLSLSNITVDETKAVKNKEQIFSFKSQQLGEALATSGEFIPFAANSADISPTAALKLLALANAIGRIIDPGMSAMNLYVFGSTGPADKTIQMGLGAKRGEAVAKFLRSKLPSNIASFIKPVSSTLMHSWIPGATGLIGQQQQPPFQGTSFSGVCLLPHVPQKQVKKLATQQYDSKYIVILHEFGHVLGLPDEYMGLHDSGLANQVSLATLIPRTIGLTAKANPAERMARQQGAMATAMAESGTVSPIFVDTGGTNLATSSVMSAGRDVLPAHYLTIWSCLSMMTINWIEPAQWKIVPKNSGSSRAFAR